MKSRTGENRVRRFQALMEEKGVSGSMIRNIYSFTYFVGTSWWQPSVLIPAQGEPIIFAFEDEVEELQEKTWISNVLGYRKVEELMRAVTENIRKLSNSGAIGFDIDIDASALLFEQFKNMHAGKKVIDVHGLIMQLRMIKDPTEIENIRKASRCAEKGLEAAIQSTRVGATETAIAGEAQRAARNNGADSVLIYVNSGKPRVHAHPRNKVIEKGNAVMVDVMPSYNGYFSDLAHTVFMSPVTEEKKKAYNAAIEAEEEYIAALKPDVPLDELEKIAQNVYNKHGVQKYYIYGFAHGVGLRFEEDPITTIVVAERKQKTLENMVLNVGHAPLSGQEIGAVKVEDTVLVMKDRAERLTSFKKDLQVP